MQENAKDRKGNGSGSTKSASGLVATDQTPAGLATARRIQAEQQLKQAKLLEDWAEKYPGYTFPEEFQEKYLDKGNIPPAPPEVREQQQKERFACVQERKELLSEVRKVLIKNFHKFFLLQATAKGAARVYDLDAQLTKLLDQVVDHQRELRVEYTAQPLTRKEKDDYREPNRHRSTSFKEFCRLHHRGDLEAAKISEKTKTGPKEEKIAKKEDQEPIEVEDVAVTPKSPAGPDARQNKDETSTEDIRRSKRAKRLRGSPQSTESEGEEAK